MKYAISGLLVLGLGAWSPPSAARSAGGPAAGPAELAEALAAWRAEHGSAWRVRSEGDTGFARLVFGGATEAAATPTTESGWFACGRRAIELSERLHGVAPEQLVAVRVKDVPLGLAGTTDKVAIRFRQELRGVPVVRAGLGVLASRAGAVLAIESTALPALGQLDLVPALVAGDARAQVARRFEDDARVPPTAVGAARLVVDRAPAGGGVLAWEVRAEYLEPGFEPRGWLYRIDARTGELTSREETVHRLDVSGAVTSFATPGTLPDTPANPEVPLPLSGLRVDSPQGSAVTDGNGAFTIAGATPPLDVTVRYAGPFAVSEDLAQPDYVLTQTLTLTAGNALAMNPAALDPVTAEANAFRWMTAARDWVQFIDPTDTTPDFLARAQVNWNATCGAFFQGSAIQMAAAMGPCNNLAYSTVVVHELGHWYNQRYGTQNGADGMGEGAADVWAMYVADTPIVGEDFTTAGDDVRTGLNTTQYWGDGNACPLGSSHTCGEVLMGAFWQMLANLRATHGQTAGRAAAGALFVGWNNAYDQTAIEDVIVEQLLALDDDDGNLENGTPNLPEIVTAFTAHGFSGFTPSVATYCAGKSNSAGCVPFLTSTGSPSATATTPFRIVGNDVVGDESGVLIYGTNGRSSLGFHNGTLCVKAPLTRLLPPKNAGSGAGGPCPGELRTNFNNRVQSGQDPSLSSGQVVNAQWLYRDPGVDAFNDGLTNGIEFLVQP